MNESANPNPITELEAFIVDNRELERLEELVGQFNLFEAIGAVRGELRHSDFLGFLLDPRRNHGLGDDFTRLFVQKALLAGERGRAEVSLVDLDVWNLTETEVRREWSNIDILLLDPVHEMAVIVENKIGSGEHSEQLPRYREIVRREYPTWKLVCIFLTPDGDQPSDDNYIALDYTTVCESIERLVERRGSTLGADVRTVMAHYTQMLRRHIVSESEIAELCRRIYKKHKQALDLIFEHRPNDQFEYFGILAGIIDADPELKVERQGRSSLIFAPARWFKSPELMAGSGWTASGQLILFQINANQPKITLWLGPGDQAARKRVLDFALANSTDGGPFRCSSKTLKQKWNTIYSRQLLSQSELEVPDEDLAPKVAMAWQKFVDGDLAEIRKRVERTFLG